MRWSGLREQPSWHWILAAALFAWTMTEGIQWWLAAPLGHDEAQYAAAAKDFLSGQPPRWFYVSNGMNAIAVSGVLVGETERALRFLPMLIGFGFAIVTFLLARRTVGGASAAWSIAVLAGARSLLQRTTELLTDVPATTCLLVAMLVVAAECSREDGPRWRFVVVAPVLAAAFYIRYASCIPIAIIGVSALAIWWRPIARRPAPVIVAVAVLGLLLVPHFLSAVRLTGSPLGIVFATQDVLGGSYGDALVTYVTSDPFKYYGRLTPIAMVAGVFAIARTRDRQVVFAWSVAVASILAMGMLQHAQSRYIFLGTTLLVVLGTDLIVRFVAARAPRVRNVIAALAIVAIAWSWITVARQAIRYPRGMRARNAGTLIAGHAIRTNARGAPCHVLGRHDTQLEYYSGCRGVLHVPLDDVGRGILIYVVRDDSGGSQPDFRSMPGRPRAIVELPWVRVIRLEP